jgi:hypothetical protein
VSGVTGAIVIPIVDGDLDGLNDVLVATGAAVPSLIHKVAVAASRQVPVQLLGPPVEEPTKQFELRSSLKRRVPKLLHAEEFWSKM